MDYNTMREFADTWGLLFLVFFFLGVLVFVFRPGGKKTAHDAAQIPLKED